MGGDRQPPTVRRPCHRFNPRPRVGGDTGVGPHHRPAPVSIHAPAWGATCNHVSNTACTCFNPRPRVGGDEQIQQSRSVFMFQSTPPRGGRRHNHLIQPDRTYCFNPRPRVGGDTTAPAAIRGTWRFNPRPRVGGDTSAHLRIDVGHVSIHAPAWGATHNRYGLRPRDVVSIHAPAWGATRKPNQRSRIQAFQSTPPRGGRPTNTTTTYEAQCFNPRPRVGGDRMALRDLARPVVSIHAPAWGATVHALGSGSARRSFNPRPRVGGDRLPSVFTVCPGRFQSTPPRGGRRTRGAVNGVR